MVRDRGSTRLSSRTWTMAAVSTRSNSRAPGMGVASDDQVVLDGVDLLSTKHTL